MQHDFSTSCEIIDFNEKLKSIIWECDCGFKVVFANTTHLPENYVQKIAKCSNNTVLILDLDHYDIKLVLNLNKFLKIEISNMLHIDGKYLSHEKTLIKEIMVM